MLRHLEERISPGQSGARGATLAKYCRRGFHRYLTGLEVGQVCLHEDGETYRFGDPDDNELTVELNILNAEFYAAAVLGGSVGTAEAYQSGYWQCDKLVDFFRIMLANRHALDQIDGFWASLGRFANRCYHRFRDNTLDGSRRNIAAHYDLGNDFFALMLDSTMSYSSAVFPQSTETLAEASVAKMELVCRKLRLTPNDKVVEIGTGWGGLAVYAAREFGAHVTTTTISQEQYEAALKRVKDAGLEHRVHVLRCDYRELQGEYDKLMSIEMIEAVGHQYYAAFFDSCSRLLKPDGLALIQAILIDDRRYEYAKKNVDFIKRYIFPGCCIPAQHVFADHISKHTDFQLLDYHDLTADYAKTMRCWLNNFRQAREQLADMGFDAAFCRMWEYYLQYCEAGFKERVIGDGQFLYAKPKWRELVPGRRP